MLNFVTLFVEIMKNYVEGFPAQLEEALEIAGKADLSRIRKNSIRNILITGLGGSGISGTIMADLTAGTCPLPVVVNKDYALPAFVDENSLVIACSYSGNTEETIAVLNSAIAKKAQIICVSSGGAVSATAGKNNLTLISIPGGNPPRASFGYPFVQLLHIFDHFSFSAPGYREQLRGLINLLRTEKDDILTSAQILAKQLLNKIPVIYCVSGMEGVAMRFRQQINENSKMLCWHHVIPEMNHNELVGWVEQHDNIAVVALRTNFDYERSVRRLEICREIISPLVSSWSELTARSSSRMGQMLYLIHLTDWVSCFLADMKKVDPVEVRVIDRLKSELSKF